MLDSGYMNGNGDGSFDMPMSTKKALYHISIRRIIYPVYPQK